MVEIAFFVKGKAKPPLCEGISLKGVMGMFMRKNELLESDLAEDRDSDTFVSISSDVSELGDGLDPSVNFAGDPVIGDLVSSLLGLSL
ncbi:hypothetical protein AYI68_g7125, partial [Smittium mucronatum]